MTDTKPWLAPVLAIGFLVLTFASFAVTGDPPNTKDNSAGEIVDFYVDKKDSVQASAAMAVVGTVLFVFFAAILRNVLRRAEGNGGGFSIVALIGAGIFATGQAIDSTIIFAISEAVEDIDPIAVQSLQALWDNDFFPFALGVALFTLGNGITILKTGALPKWLGWIAIVLGVVALTPIGFVAAGLTALWILVTSFLLARGTHTGPGTRTADTRTT